MMFWLAAALVALLLVFHNYALPVLPRRTIELTAADIQPVAGQKPHVFSVQFNRSEPQRRWINRSAVRLYEDNRPYSNSLLDPLELYEIGGRRYIHFADEIRFATEYNSDPRSNGHRYRISYPVLYSQFVGLVSLGVLIISIVALYARTRKQPGSLAPVTPAQPDERWYRWIALAVGVQLAGLYLNTGTLSPYAITTFPHQSPTTGYLFNPDHIHFEDLYEFADGQPRERWDGAIMLRRILFPILAWPFTKLGGFETGGTVASLTLNAIGLLTTVGLVRRRLGPKGALATAWLVALYPGAAYWGGLPYPYVLITPVCLVLLYALDEIAQAKGRRFLGWSVIMGFGYLAYDLAPIFLPASLLVLLLCRRPGAAIITAIIQVIPLGLWIWFLRFGLQQELTNSNSTTYGAILNAYRSVHWDEFIAQASALPELAAAIFFGSNFLFLPALFVALIIINPLTARIRLTVGEIGVLVALSAIFLFNHLAPDYGGWQMKGTWIARVYQPAFAVFIFFAARWYTHQETYRFAIGKVGLAFFTLMFIGNGLVIAGPATKNPGRVSEEAFVRFYRHNDNWIYEFCLQRYGRRPLGFPVEGH